MLGFYDFLIIFCILLIISIIYWYATIPKNLPPGPFGAPFLGSFWEFRRQQDQHLVLLELVKKYGALMRLYIGNHLFIILGDYDTIQEALVKQGDSFAGRPAVQMAPEKIIGLGLVNSEGDLWKEQRRFTLSTLRDFGIGRPIIEPKISEEIDHLTDRIQEFERTGSPFDPQPLLVCCVANILSQLIFGRRFDYDDQEFKSQFLKMSEWMRILGFFNPIMFSQAIASLMKRIIPRHIREEIDSGMAFYQHEIDKTVQVFDAESEPTNYIHAFMKAGQQHPGGTFTEDQLFSSVIDLFGAGTESTSSTLCYALLILATHPDVQERMYQEIKDQVGTSSLPGYADRMKLPFSEAVVMETQRFVNLNPFGVGRRALQDTKLMGYDIPKDAIVVAFLTNVNHNPEIFPEPEIFNPSRFLDSDGKVVRDPKLIPFLAGKRICPGESLARMELFLVLVGLVSRYRFYFRDDQTRPDLKPVVGLMSAPKKYQVYVEARND